MSDPSAKLPIFDREGNLFDADDGYRADSDLEKLGRLPPAQLEDP